MHRADGYVGWQKSFTYVFAGSKPEQACEHYLEQRIPKQVTSRKTFTSVTKAETRERAYSVTKPFHKRNKQSKSSTIVRLSAGSTFSS